MSRLNDFRFSAGQQNHRTPVTRFSGQQGGKAQRLQEKTNRNRAQEEHNLPPAATPSTTGNRFIFPELPTAKPDDSFIPSVPVKANRASLLSSTSPLAMAALSMAKQYGAQDTQKQRDKPNNKQIEQPAEQPVEPVGTATAGEATPTPQEDATGQHSEPGTSVAQETTLVITEAPAAESTTEPAQADNKATTESPAIVQAQARLEQARTAFMAAKQSVTQAEATLALALQNAKDQRLADAIEAGKTEQIIQALASGAGPAAIIRPAQWQSYMDKTSPTVLAARKNQVETLKLLHAAGVDMNAADAKGVLPLQSAIIGNNVESVRWLLTEGGANPNASITQTERRWADGKPQPQPVKQTMLMLAAEMGHEEIVNLLLEHQADATVVNENQQSALVYAATTHNGKSLQAVGPDGKSLPEDQAKALLADPAKKDSVPMAMRSTHPRSAEMVKTLLKVSEPSAETLKQALQAAANGEDKDVLAAILAHQTFDKADLDAAIANTQMADTMLLLLKAGASHDIADAHGNTIAMKAAELGDDALMDYLIQERKADLNVRNHSGDDALMRAIQGRGSNKAFVEKLLAAGADATYVSPSGRSALGVARYFQLKDVIPLLEQKNPWWRKWLLHNR